MGLIPNDKPGKVAFFNAKIAPWTANAVAIGTTAAAVTDLTAKLATASTKLDAQVAAQEVAKAATAAADEAVAALVTAGVDIIKQVRVKASTAGNGVYQLAQIPAPATPTPVGTLGTPTHFTAELKATGALALKWKCASPRATGTVYQVWRRTAPAGEFTYLGGSGTKAFVDDTIPAGSSQVTYQIQAVRSTAVGDFAQFNVNFGTPTSSGGASATIASVEEAAPTKRAA